MPLTIRKDYETKNQKKKSNWTAKISIFPYLTYFTVCIRLAPCIPRWYFLCTITLEQREGQKTITFFSKWWIHKLLNYGTYCTEACENPAVVILYISCKHLSDTKLHMWSRTGSYLGSVLTQHCDDIQVTSCSSESQCSQTVMWPSIQLKIEGGIVVGVNLLLLTPNDASLWTHMMFKKLHGLFFFLPVLHDQAAVLQHQCGPGERGHTAGGRCWGHRYSNPHQPQP